MSHQDEEARLDTRGRRLPTLSLRVKLLLFAAMLVIVPGVLFGFMVLQSEERLLQQLIGTHLVREAGHTADRLSSILSSEREILKSFAQQDLMREVRVGDIDKRVSLALKTLRDGDPARVDYFVLDADYRVIASSDPAALGESPAWLAAAESSNGGIQAVSGPAEMTEPGRSELLLATSIRDPDDRRQVVAALVGLYDWERLTTVLETVRRNLTAEGIRPHLFVTRRDGAVVSGTRPSPGDEALSPADFALPAAHRSSQGPGFRVNERGGLLIGRAPLQGEFSGWDLVIVERLSDAFEPARRMARRLASILALTLAVALGFAFLAGRSVVRPLGELTAAIRGVSRGDLSALRVPVRSEDEVGSLALAFNRMASELDQAQQDLVEAAKYALVGELAAGVAHEVRTSLGVVRSSTQILERSLPDESSEETAELAQLIRAEVDRLGGIVNDLLELGRPRALHLEAIEIAAPLRRAIELVEPNASEHGIQILWRPANGPGRRVRCDPELIHQVALNLLVNAIQAIGEGGRVEVSTFDAGTDGYIGFSVQDDGPGIPVEFRDKLFRPFATAREGGIGLGLTFVQRVVYEHQGRVHVESEPGGGACFRVELPPAEESI